MSVTTYKLFYSLDKNYRNTIVYYRNNERFSKNFNEVNEDVDKFLRRIDHLNSIVKIKNVALIGPTSYEWLLIDLACIKGNYITVAIPEGFAENKIKEIIERTEANLILCDYSLKEKCSFVDTPKYFFNSEEEEDDFEKVPEMNENRFRGTFNKNFSIGFSSGTSANLKYVNLQLEELETTKNELSFKEKISRYLYYKTTFWSYKDNKVIIFLPFSHPIQRSIVRSAIERNFDIVLSDARNCFQHITKESPNIMFAVPYVYEHMALRIQNKLKKFSGLKKIGLFLFNFLKINTLGNRNIIKVAFSYLLFNDIKRIYGGRGDYFVVGSASTDINALKVFYKVGIKIFQAYGQTESSNIISKDGNFRIGSVGNPKKFGIEVIISEDSEILIKYEKHHEKNEHILNVKDGYIHTGDIGYLDKDGYLFVKGRKDNVIVLKSGKKIFPEVLEDIYRDQENIIQILITSYNEQELSAIILSELNDIRKLNKYINRINNKLADHEKLMNFYVTQDKLLFFNDNLTSTFKLKRNAIKEKYKEEHFIKVIN